MTRLSIQTVSRLMADGTIPCRRIGRRVLCPRDELQVAHPWITDEVIDRALNGD